MGVTKMRLRRNGRKNKKYKNNGSVFYVIVENKNNYPRYDKTYSPIGNRFRVISQFYFSFTLETTRRNAKMKISLVVILILFLSYNDLLIVSGKFLISAR